MHIYMCIYIYIYTHICIIETLCCTPEPNTTLYINYTSIKKNSNLDIIFEPWILAKWHNVAERTLSWNSENLGDHLITQFTSCMILGKSVELP